MFPPYLKGHVTHVSNTLKSKQVLKRSQVKSGIDSMDSQTQLDLPLFYMTGSPIFKGANTTVYSSNQNAVSMQHYKCPWFQITKVAK